MRAMSGTGSMALEEVVPTVAQTKQGTRPAALSCVIWLARASGRRAKFLSTGMARRCSEPRPAILAAFSTEECVWVEQYATNLPSQPRVLLANRVARSRPASKAQSEALEAVS